MGRISFAHNIRGLKKISWTIVRTAMLTTVAALLTSTIHAQQATYQYDKLGRLIRVDYPDGKASEYVYDAAGNRVQVKTGGAFLGADVMNAAPGDTTDYDPLRNDTAMSGLPLTVTAVTDGALGTTTVIDGGRHVRYTTSAASGSDSFTYTASDGIIENTGTVSVNIVAGAVKPTLVDDGSVTNEDVATTIPVLANDLPAGVTISYITQPNHGTTAISATGDSVTYTPSANYFGTDVFTYGITNGTIEDVGFVNLTVNSVNDPPVANNDSLTVTEDIAKTFGPISNDTDVETATSNLVITGKTNGTKGTVQIIGTPGTQLKYTPNANANGADSFTYTIADEAGATDTANVNVTITPVNDPPNAVNDSKTTNEDTAITFDPRINDSDVEGSPLTITAKTNGTHGNVTIVSGTQLRYNPGLNYHGSDSFTYTISDGSLTDTATVSMTVKSVNDPPNAVADSYTVDMSVWTNLNVKNNDSDVDGDAFSITAISGNTSGAEIVIQGGSYISYRCLNCASDDFFRYTITDSHGATDTAGVSVFLGGGGGLPKF